MTRRIFRLGLSGGDAAWNAKNEKNDQSVPHDYEALRQQRYLLGFGPGRSLIDEMLGAQQNRPSWADGSWATE